MSKAATRAKSKYNTKAYDQVKFWLPKGRRDEIKQQATRAGLSLAAYLDAAAAEKAERDGLMEDNPK